MVKSNEEIDALFYFFRCLTFTNPFSFLPQFSCMINVLWCFKEIKFVKRNSDDSDDIGHVALTLLLLRACKKSARGANEKLERYKTELSENSPN